MVSRRAGSQAAGLSVRALRGLLEVPCNGRFPAKHDRPAVGPEFTASVPSHESAMAIPTHRLEIFDLVGTTVRAVPPVMDLQGPPRAAAGATAAMLLEGHDTVQRVDAIDHAAQGE